MVVFEKLSENQLCEIEGGSFIKSIACLAVASVASVALSSAMIWPAVSSAAVAGAIVYVGYKNGYDSVK